MDTKIMTRSRRSKKAEPILPRLPKNDVNF